MKLEQRRQAMLQLHLSNQQFNFQLKCVLYERLDGMYDILDISVTVKRKMPNGYIEMKELLANLAKAS